MEVHFNGEASTSSGMLKTNDENNYKRETRWKRICNAKVIYICDEALLYSALAVSRIGLRNVIVNDLLNAYQLNQYIEVISSRPASYTDLEMAHSPAYIRFISSYNLDIPNPSDCLAFTGFNTSACNIAGSTLTAAQALIDGICGVAVNWFGGWHHADRDGSHGINFLINDVVLGIEKLRERFNRILYIDFDVHHGTEVEAAYASYRSILTLSFHEWKHNVLYLQSGALDSVGVPPAKYYTANIPLKEGITDYRYVRIFKRVVSAVYDAFKPDAVVVQCGGDGLASDPCGSFNLTHLGYAACIQEIMKWKLATLYLGGGGYDMFSTAHLWAYLTAVILRKHIGNEIPLETKQLYGLEPSHQLTTNCPFKRDYNTLEDEEIIVSFITASMKIVRQQVIEDYTPDPDMEELIQFKKKE